MCQRRSGKLLTVIHNPEQALFLPFLRLAFVLAIPANPRNLSLMLAEFEKQLGQTLNEIQVSETSFRNGVANAQSIWREAGSAPVPVVDDARPVRAIMGARWPYVACRG